MSGGGINRGMNRGKGGLIEGKECLCMYICMCMYVCLYISVCVCMYV